MGSCCQGSLSSLLTDMSNIQHLQFKEFAEDADVHGVKQLTRADNGLVSSHLLYPLYYQLEKKTSFHNFYGSQLADHKHFALNFRAQYAPTNSLHV